MLRIFIKNNLTKCLLIFLYLIFQIINLSPNLSDSIENNLLGKRVNKNARWFGNKSVLPSTPIIIMAGHADSQNIPGAGTRGEAVGLKGLQSMDLTMTDELFWNLKIRDAVVKVGKEHGLDISSYEPGVRSIVDENHPKTNWSAGARYAAQGLYVLEIHFDSYGVDGLGAGLIPPITSNLNNIDESLAQNFGRYPLFFRGGLGAARRQIRILEIGKLEGNLERNLRDIKTRENTIYQIAFLIVESIKKGINNELFLNPLLQEGDIFLRGSYQQTNPEAL